MCANAHSGKEIINQKVSEEFLLFGPGIFAKTGLPGRVRRENPEIGPRQRGLVLLFVFVVAESYQIGNQIADREDV